MYVFTSPHHVHSSHGPPRLAGISPTMYLAIYMTCLRTSLGALLEFGQEVLE